MRNTNCSYFLYLYLHKCLLILDICLVSTALLTPFKLCSFCVATDFFLSLHIYSLDVTSIWRRIRYNWWSMKYSDFICENHGRKRRRNQLYEIINIDKINGQSAGHLGHWPTNDTLRTLVLTTDWVLQFSGTFLHGIPGEETLIQRRTESQVFFFVSVAPEVSYHSDSCDDHHLHWNGRGPRPKGWPLHKSFRWVPITKYNIFSCLYPSPSLHIITTHIS